MPIEADGTVSVDCATPSVVPRRRFGRTGISLPVFTCGGMRFQHSWNGDDTGGVTDEMREALDGLVRKALSLGINHFETARGYGTSEVELGGVLPRLPRDEIIVQTKVAPAADPGDFRRTFETSLGNLGLDSVDLFALHGINNEEFVTWSLRKGGCLREALAMRDEGLCRFVGFSAHGALPQIVRMIDTGAFDYINLHWYFVFQQNWPAILAARRQDMGVFIISPNDKGGMLYKPPQKLVELCAPLHPMQFNDLWCLARDEVHTLSIGAARESDFDAHIDGLRHYDQRTSITAEISERMEREMRRVLGDDWFERWTVGLPDYTEVPGEVHLREILRYWSLARSLDMVEYGKYRYNLFGNGGHWFPGSNSAAFSDEAMAACLARSPFAGRIPGILREAHQLLADQPKQRLSQGG